MIFNLGRISISIKFEFYLKISTLAHSLSHIKKIPPNINCCVALFDKNENIKTYLQFIRVTSLCSREPVRNEISYLYLCLMSVFHLKITVRPGPARAADPVPAREILSSVISRLSASASVSAWLCWVRRFDIYIITSLLVTSNISPGYFLLTTPHYSQIKGKPRKHK